MNAKQFNPPYGTHYAIREMARKLYINMSTIKQILVIAAFVVLTAFAVSAYNDYVQFEALRAEHMIGECEHRGDYTVCSEVKVLYEGPPR